MTSSSAEEKPSYVVSKERFATLVDIEKKFPQSSSAISWLAGSPPSADIGSYMCYASNGKVIVFRYKSKDVDEEKFTGKSIVITDDPIVVFTALKPIPEKADGNSFQLYVDEYYRIGGELEKKKKK